MLQAIDKEIKVSKKKKDGSIIIKLNSLVDKILIDKLYVAAKSGVQVNMVIRGICCAYTEQKSLKGHLHAISIIDEYLEHARVMVFGNQGNPVVYISSADWMIRNIDHRVEVACPIYDPEIKNELINILHIQLAENVKGRILDNEQTNQYVTAEEGSAVIRSQVEIYKYLRNKKY